MAPGAIVLPAVINMVSMFVLLPTVIKFGENAIEPTPVELAAFDNMTVVLLITEATVVPAGIPLPVTAHPADTAIKLALVVRVLLANVLLHDTCNGAVK